MVAVARALFGPDIADAFFYLSGRSGIDASRGVWRFTIGGVWNTGCPIACITVAACKTTSRAVVFYN